MPTVHKSEQWIPEVKGKISGGATIMLHHPDDVEALRIIFHHAPKPPETPMKSVYEVISASDVDFDKWLKWKDDYQYLPENFSDLKNLDEALTQVKLAWRKHEKKGVEIKVAVALATPESDAKDTLELESEYPAMVIHHGSTLVSILKGAGMPLRVTKWAVLVFSPAPAPSRIAAELVDSLRIEATNGRLVEPLERLTPSIRDSLQDKDGMIIFLHGLLSTDLGLFDGLIKRLRADESCNNVGLFGWPHNTLIDIQTNADSLASLIESLIDLEQQAYRKIIFVCHSRGGLVARQTALKLYERPKFKKALRRCVTFGTPHEGSELTELPDSLFSLYVARQYFDSVSFLPAFQNLVWLSEQKDIRGITDMRPREAGGEFLKKLKDEERKQAIDQDKIRLLEIFAVGGDLSKQPPAQSWLYRLGYEFTNQKLAGPNDIAVRTASSIPDDHKFFMNQQTDCDHFSYFTDTEMNKLYVKKIIEFIKEEFTSQPIEGEKPAASLSRTGRHKSRPQRAR